MAAETNAKPEAAKEGGVLSRLSELFWQALPAIGSAVGFAGFVAVIGAAIEWIRFNAVNLPATQAVLAVPRQELVIIGAIALVGFVVGGVLAVLVVYLIDNDGDATPNTARGLVIVGVLEMIVTLFFIGVHHRITYVLLGIWLALIGVVAANFVVPIMRNFTNRSRLKSAREQAVEACEKLAVADATKAAAVTADQAHPSDATAASRVQAASALVAAEREWERAIRAWGQAHGDLASELPKTMRAGADERGAPGGPEGEGEDRSPEIAAGAQPNNPNYPTEMVDRYLANAPNGGVLEQQLEEADRDLGHVFRVVGVHWRAQLLAFRNKLDVFLGAISRLIAKSKGKSKGAEGSSALEDQDPSQARADEQDETLPLHLIAWIVAAIVSALIIYGIVLVASERSFSWVAILLGVAAVLAMMNLFVARATETFAWYGMSVFFSVLIFGAALTLARTMAEPSVQPIALVRKSDAVGVCGVFVAQTNERVYVGRLAAKGIRPGMLFWVPTKDVELVDVGQSEHVGRKLPRLTVTMLSQLYKDRAEAGPAVKNTTVTEVEGGPAPAKQTTTARETPPPPPPTSHPPVKVGETCTSPQTVYVPPRVDQ
jgi:ABC-type multidrug transport system fused ATPase/permease subunit